MEEEKAGQAVGHGGRGGNILNFSFPNVKETKKNTSRWMLCLMPLTCLSARETREGSWKSRFKNIFWKYKLTLPPYINCNDSNCNLFLSFSKFRTSGVRQFPSWRVSGREGSHLRGRWQPSVSLAESRVQALWKVWSLKRSLTSLLRPATRSSRFSEIMQHELIWLWTVWPDPTHHIYITYRCLAMYSQVVSKSGVGYCNQIIFTSHIWSNKRGIGLFARNPSRNGI